MFSIRSCLLILICLVLPYFCATKASSIEFDTIDTPQACFLDGHYVLLYKIINWWNDSSTEDESLLCGDTLRCRSRGTVNVMYDQKEKTMVISCSAEYLELLSIIGSCSSCDDPVKLRVRWLNDMILGEMPQTATLTIDSGVCRIFFNNISTSNAEVISAMALDLQMSLSGTIEGLLLADGRIALHKNGVFLKDCGEAKNISKHSSKVQISLSNITTEEVLARFELERQNT